MAYRHWFVSRQKRQLTTILLALIAFSDVCVGQKWAGNTKLQLKFEDELQTRNITGHGRLRARKAGQGGGGIRTLFKQLKDLGLIFAEDDNGKCQLTLIGEELVKGNVTFVTAMRLQLQKYQYPSAAVWSGSGSVDHEFRVHPFQFMFRLLRDPRLNNTLSMEEMSGIVIHYAKSDSVECFEDVVNKILEYRAKGTVDGFVEDTPTKTYNNIANTFFNFISLTQYVDRGWKTLMVRSGKETEADDFIQEKPKFIPNPELAENYQRAYGRGKSAKDLRNFEHADLKSQKALNEARIQKEYVLLGLKTPITGITPDIVEAVAANTGIDENIVEKFLVKNYPHGNIDDFFLSYKELAHLGTEGAKDFEEATCEMFRKIFRMRAEHVGPIGNTPDVFVESKECGFCGIIDNKAYKNGYSISGNHKRVMEDVYIPNYRKYGKTDMPLAFFTYIAGSFGKNINGQVQTIYQDTGIDGSAMPVDILINIAQDYADKGYTHDALRRIFSVNREVRLRDVENALTKNNLFNLDEFPAAMAAEDSAPYGENNG